MAPGMSGSVMRETQMPFVELELLAMARSSRLIGTEHKVSGEISRDKMRCAYSKRPRPQARETRHRMIMGVQHRMTT
jgi:hypothetical protein